MLSDTTTSVHNDLIPPIIRRQSLEDINENYIQTSKLSPESQKNDSEKAASEESIKDTLTAMNQILGKPA
jgi:hypothetical protein